jgi:UDP-N-acetylmuramoylalanine--D-glutamate ligase
MTPLDLVDGAVRDVAFLESLARRPVTVVGVKRDAGSAIRLLEARNADVRVEPPATIADLTREALVVVTDGRALHEPAVARARDAGVIVLSDLDVVWLASGVEAFAITGGHDPGGATRLAGAVLAARARTVGVVDGVDCDVEDADVLLVKPTMEQLGAMQVFRPRVAILLRGADPLAARLTTHQTMRDCLVVADDDPDLRHLARETRAHVVWLSATHALEHGVYVARGQVTARLNGQVEEICRAPALPLAHLEAALAAVACALWAGLDPGAIGAALTRPFAVQRALGDRLRQPSRRAG